MQIPLVYTSLFSGSKGKRKDGYCLSSLASAYNVDFVAKLVSDLYDEIVKEKLIL